MDFARRIAEYDLMRAYAWWRGLPGLVRAVLFLPLAATPAVATFAFTMIFCAEVRQAIVFAWLFAGFGQIATVFLAFVLPNIGRIMWACAFAFARIAMAKYYIFDHADYIKASVPYFGAYIIHIEFIEYATLFISLWLTFFTFKKTSTPLDTERGPSQSSEIVYPNTKKTKQHYGIFG